MNNDTGAINVVVNTRSIDIETEIQGHLTTHISFTPASVELTYAMVKYLELYKHIMVNRLSAERLILEIGSAEPVEVIKNTTITGLDMIENVPSRTVVMNSEVYEAIKNIVDEIVNNIVIQVKHVLKYDLKNSLTEYSVRLKGDFKDLYKLDSRLSIELNTLVKPHQ